MSDPQNEAGWLKAIFGSLTGLVSSAPATAYTKQQVVTAGAVVLGAQALVNGVVIKAKSSNVGKVFIGYDNTVTTADDGTGKGYPIAAGEAMSFAVSNTSALWIIGSAGDIIYVGGN